MQKQLTFEKDPDGRWYVVLPEWPEEERDALQMVCGADLMCDILAQGEDNITKTISLNKVSDPIITLTKLFDTPTNGGATYISEWDQKLYKVSNFELWLCDVTQHVFGELPETIYIK